MEPLSVTDLKFKLMRETMGTLGVLLLNLGKQTGIMEALRGGDKLSTSETQQREEVETDNVVCLLYIVSCHFQAELSPLVVLSFVFCLLSSHPFCLLSFIFCPLSGLS